MEGMARMSYGPYREGLAKAAPQIFRRTRCRPGARGAAQSSPGQRIRRTNGWAFFVCGGKTSSLGESLCQVLKICCLHCLGFRQERNSRRHIVFIDVGFLIVHYVPLCLHCCLLLPFYMSWSLAPGEFNRGKSLSELFGGT